MIEVNSPVDEMEFARLCQVLRNMDEQQRLTLGRQVSQLRDSALAYLQEARMFSGVTKITKHKRCEVNRLEVEQVLMGRLLRLLPLP